jgi:hypothetical protein
VRKALCFSILRPQTLNPKQVNKALSYDQRRDDEEIDQKQFGPAPSSSKKATEAQNMSEGRRQQASQKAQSVSRDGESILGKRSAGKGTPSDGGKSAKREKVTPGKQVMSDGCGSPLDGRKDGGGESGGKGQRVEFIPLLRHGGDPISDSNPLTLHPKTYTPKPQTLNQTRCCFASVTSEP